MKAVSKKKLFFASILIFANLIFSQNAQSSEQVQDISATPEKPQGIDGAAITEFNITGLKRTKNRYMQKILSRFEGRPANAETINEIETALQAENLFDEIQVSAEPVSQNATAINISLKEKWSFIPLPFVAVTDGNFMAGLFLIDMNAFGLHDIFMAGGIYSKEMLMGMGAYVKQPHKKGEFGFATSFAVSKRDYTFSDARDNAMLEYDAFSLSAGANILYKPTNKTSVSLGGGYGFFNPSENDSVFKMNFWNINAAWNFLKSSYNGIFLSSNGISISGNLYFSDNDDFKIAQSLFAKCGAQIPVSQKIRLLGTLNGFWGNDLHCTQYQNRMAAGVSILPNDFRTQEILGISAGAEFCIAKIKFGMISVYALYQAAFAQDWDESFYIGHGPEAGVRVYLAKIAFPAISIGGSYNVVNNSLQYNFSFGASF